MCMWQFFSISVGNLWAAVETLKCYFGQRQDIKIGPSIRVKGHACQGQRSRGFAGQLNGHDIGRWADPAVKVCF